MELILDFQKIGLREGKKEDKVMPVWWMLIATQ